MQLYGYDYSFALTTDVVNQLLAAGRAPSVSISGEGTDTDTGLTYSISTVLGAWSVVTGGSGSLLRISCPLASGTLSVTGEPDASLAGLTAILEVSLSWLNSGGQVVTTGSGAYTSLSINLGQATDPNAPSYVSVVSVVGNLAMSVVQQALLQSALLHAVLESQANLSSSLASVNPAAPGTPSWLKPVSWNYFYTDIDDGKGLLCFLCMLSSAAAPAGPSFDTSAYESTANAIILISQEMFFQNMLLPAFQASLPGVSLSVQEVNGNLAITASGSFSFGGLAAQTFTVTASPTDGSLTMNAGGDGNIDDLFSNATAPNATYSWSGSTCNPLVFNAQEQSIGFAPDPNPQSSASNSIPWYDYPLIGACTVATFVSGGNPGQVIDNLAAVSTGTVNSVAARVTAALQRNMNGSFVNLSSIIEWSAGSTTFAITNAGLQGALYLAGNLTSESGEST